MPWPSQFWPANEWPEGPPGGEPPPPPPPAPPAVKVFTFAAPTGVVGSTFFLPLDFRARLLLLFGNGRSENVNTVGQRTVLECRGVATGPTNQFCSFGRARHQSIEKYAVQSFLADAVYASFQDATTTATGGRLAVESIGASGIVFKVTEQFLAEHRICGIAIGGALQAKIITIGEPGATGQQDYSGAGFEPQQAFFLTTEVTAPGELASSQRYYHAFGLVASPSQQRIAKSAAKRDLAGIGGQSGTEAGSACLRGTDSGLNDGVAAATLVSFLPDGFRLDWTARQLTGRQYIAVLMAGNYQIHLTQVLTDQFGGNINVSGMPGKPDAVLLIGGGKTAHGFDPTNTATVGAFTTPDERWALGHALPQQIIIAGIDAYSGIRFDDGYLRLKGGGSGETPLGEISNRLDVNSIVTNGYILRSEAGDGAARIFFSWAWIDIGEGEGAAPSELCLEADPGLVVFSHDPDWADGIRERTAWLTDILPGYTAAEQRIALRRHPRIALEFGLTSLEAADTAFLDALLYGWQGNRYAVPLWPDAVRLEENAAVGATQIAVTTALRRFAAGGRALLWRDPFTYELVEIDAVNPNSLDLAAATQKAWAADGRTWVIPAFAGRLQDAQPVDRAAAFASILKARFEFEPQPGLAPAPDSFPQYRGYDVLELGSSEDPKDTLSRNRFRLDNRTGFLYTLDRSKRALVERSGHLLILRSRAKIEELRRFLWARRGALMPFWLPSGRQELVLAADVAAAGTTVQIKFSGYTDLMFPQPARRHLAFRLPDGTRIYRGVVDALAGQNTESLTLDAAPGIDVSSSSRVSFLTLNRLAEDDPELLWHTKEIAESSLAFIELPAEAPDPAEV